MLKQIIFGLCLLPSFGFAEQTNLLGYDIHELSTIKTNAGEKLSEIIETALQMRNKNVNQDFTYNFDGTVPGNNKTSCNLGYYSLNKGSESFEAGLSAVEHVENHILPMINLHNIVSVEDKTIEQNSSIGSEASVLEFIFHTKEITPVVSGEGGTPYIQKNTLQVTTSLKTGKITNIRITAGPTLRSYIVLGMTEAWKAEGTFTCNID